MIHNAQHTEMQDYKTSAVEFNFINQLSHCIASGLFFHIPNHTDAGGGFFNRITYRSLS
ncbi:MAG: hypothetical protein ABJC12_14210 [Saprospiraceae bacterium]